MMLAPAPVRPTPGSSSRVVDLTDPRMGHAAAAPPVDRDRRAHDRGLGVGDMHRTQPGQGGRGAAGAIAQAIIEVLAGLRPVAQLSPHVTPAVLAQIRSVAAAPGVGVRSPRQRIGHLRVTSPTIGVIEACAVIRGGPRSRALALRLESLDGRWRCSALEAG